MAVRRLWGLRRRLKGINKILLQGSRTVEAHYSVEAGSKRDALRVNMPNGIDTSIYELLHPFCTRRTG